MANEDLLSVLVQLREQLPERQREALRECQREATIYARGWFDGAAGERRDRWDERAEQFGQAYALHVARGMAGVVPLTWPPYGAALRNWQAGLLLA